MRRQAGASNTEYILIVVMIALASIFMVKGLGVELRHLFSGATNRLNFENGNVPDDGPVDPGDPGPGPAPTPDPPTPPPPSPTPPQPDHDAECQQQLSELQNERSTTGAQLAEARRNAQLQLQEAMRRERYWVPGHHSRWGYGSSGHWAYRYVHSAAERQAAQEQANQASDAYRNWNQDWRQRYRDWQANCGH